MYKKYSEQVVKDLMCDNINSYEFGKIHVQDGTRPQKCSKTPHKASEFYNIYKECFNQFEIDADKNVVVSGNYETNRHTLQDTAIPAFEPEEESLYPTIELFESYKPVIMSVVKKLSITQLSSSTISDMDRSYFDPTTHPGFTQQKLCKKNTKEHAFKTSRHVARSIFNQLDKISKTTRSKLVSNFITKRPRTRGLYSIGARNKRDFTYDNYEVAKSRAVHMPEFHNEMVIAPWLDEINELIKCEASGPIYIGNSISSYERYQKDVNKRKFYYEGDWRHYDSTIRVIGLLIVCCIARLYYPLYCKRADVHFYFIFYNIVIKDYLQPGGNVTRILNGLPSGSKCTSIFNSIYNCVALLKVLEGHDYKKINLAVGGDDFVIFSDIELSEVEIDKIKQNAFNIGMEFKIFEPKSFETDNVEHQPYFYKYSVKGDKPIISTSILLERILMPFNLVVKNNIEYLEFLDAQIPLLGFPTTALLPFYAIYSNVYNAIYNRGSPDKITVLDVFKLHSKAYNGFKYTYRRRLNVKDYLTFRKRAMINLELLSPSEKINCRVIRNITVGYGMIVYKPIIDD